MDVAAVAEMLEQWAQWSRQDRGGPQPATCRSAESRHRPAAGELFADPDLRALRPRIADDLGMRVERAVTSAGRLYAVALTLTYINGLPVQIISRRLGVPDAGRVIDEAHAAVAARLR